MMHQKNIDRSSDGLHLVLIIIIALWMIADWPSLALVVIAGVALMLALGAVMVVLGIVQKCLR